MRTVSLGTTGTETLDGTQKGQVRDINIARGGDVLVADFGELVLRSCTANECNCNDMNKRRTPGAKKDQTNLIFGGVQHLRQVNDTLSRYHDLLLHKHIDGLDGTLEPSGVTL